MCTAMIFNGFSHDFQ